MSSMDWQHGFSLQPANIHIQIHPNYELVLTITPRDDIEVILTAAEFHRGEQNKGRNDDTHDHHDECR